MRGDFFLHRVVELEDSTLTRVCSASGFSSDEVKVGGMLLASGSVVQVSQSIALSARVALSARLLLAHILWSNVSTHCPLANRGLLITPSNTSAM